MFESLHANFPKFADQLALGRGDPIEEAGEPASEGDILQIESRLGVVLSESYKHFLRCTRNLSMRAGIFRFGPEFPFFHNFPTFDQLPPEQQKNMLAKNVVWPPVSLGMLCFADFFLEADGDQLLFDIQGGLKAGEYPVVYYSHENHPPSIRKIADGFSGFLDNCFSYFQTES